MNPARYNVTQIDMPSGLVQLGHSGWLFGVFPFGTAMLNTQWRLQTRPKGMVKPSDFVKHIEPVPTVQVRAAPCIDNSIVAAK